MATEEIANQPSATLELPDAKLSLWRGCKFLHGSQPLGTGDHMIVKHKMIGTEEDVVIIWAGEKQAVKRVVHHIEFPSGKGSYSFADLDADNERRLLALYKLFDEKA